MSKPPVPLCISAPRHRGACAGKADFPPPHISSVYLQNVLEWEWAACGSCGWFRDGFLQAEGAGQLSDLSVASPCTLGWDWLGLWVPLPSEPGGICVCGKENLISEITVKQAKDRKVLQSLSLPPPTQKVRNILGCIYTLMYQPLLLIRVRIFPFWSPERTIKLLILYWKREYISRINHPE